MLFINLRLSWPKKSGGRYTPQKDYFYWDKRITKNKCFSIQVTKWSGSCDWTLFKFELDLSFWGQDHAGPLLMLDLFNYGVVLNWYDKRHWSYEKGTWHTDDDDIMDCCYEEKVGIGKWYYTYGPDWRKKHGPFLSQREAFNELKKRIDERI